MPVDSEYSGYNPEGEGCAWCFLLMVIDILCKSIDYLALSNGKIMTGYGIFMGYILVLINIVECIRKPPNDILGVKNSDPEIHQIVNKKGAN